MQYDDFIILRDFLSEKELSTDFDPVKKGKLEKHQYFSNGQITRKGIDALHEYKVDNAIIMAAGLSSRFAPLSYERPKGLTPVKGQVLIERQIEQLHEVGITDITVVVGYKATEFEYLAEKYSVDIVLNREYSTRNNHASLWLVADKLQNTYICSSDNYFEENPFQTYEWKASYSAQYVHGDTDEWCIKTDDNDTIKDVCVGGRDSWIMIGPAYFDKAFSEKFKKILIDSYPLEETKNKLWESLFIEHLSDLDMSIKRFDPPIIKEFDRIDEAIAFDKNLLNHVDSGIIDRIVATLGCQRTDIHELYPLKAGLTNLSCHFRVGNSEYVYRHPGVGTELLVDRQAEFQALAFAKELGIDGTFFAGNAKEGWKISHFIRNARQLDAGNPIQRQWAMSKLRLLHEGQGKLPRRFCFLEEGHRYEQLVDPEILAKVPGYHELTRRIAELSNIDPQKNLSECVTHNDFFSLNILLTPEDEMHVIDWEYAGMGDYANDYGTFVVTSQLDDNTADQALKEYFSREPSIEEKIHNAIYVAYAGWCWYAWAILKEAQGDCVGDWRRIYEHYASHYCDRAECLFKEFIK